MRLLLKQKFQFLENDIPKVLAARELEKEKEGKYVMSAIRQQAIEMIERMPETKIHYLINILKNIEELMASSDAEEQFDSQTAYQELEKYRKKGIEDRNYKEELYAALEEKYANIN